MKKSRVRKILLYTAYLVFSVVLLLEIALRLYNPFHFRIQGANITLETNKKYIIDNSRIPVLDKSIVHTVNSMGFRGQEKPKNFSTLQTIITIGGSTTECTYLNDGKTWTDVVYRKMKADYPNAWVNNGGIAGHSTFGHIALMKDYIIKIKPRYALFLVGINDVRRNDLTDSDKSNMSKHYKNFLTFLSRKSELCNVVINILRTREAKKRNLADTHIDLKKKADHLVLNDEAIAEYLRNDQPFLATYHDRLNTLIELCRKIIFNRY